MIVEIPDRFCTQFVNVCLCFSMCGADDTLTATTTAAEQQQQQQQLHREAEKMALTGRKCSTLDDTSNWNAEHGKVLVVRQRNTFTLLSKSNVFFGRPSCSQRREESSFMNDCCWSSSPTMIGSGQKMTDLLADIPLPPVPRLVFARIMIILASGSMVVVYYVVHDEESMAKSFEVFRCCSNDDAEVEESCCYIDTPG